tara:strand:+ start:7542 stop:7646 length:105 start_codon:yes stop_codon:yes gene_type:complete
MPKKKKRTYSQTKKMYVGKMNMPLKTFEKYFGKK